MNASTNTNSVTLTRTDTSLEFVQPFAGQLSAPFFESILLNVSYVRGPVRPDIEGIHIGSVTITVSDGVNEDTASTEVLVEVINSGPLVLLNVS